MMLGYDSQTNKSQFDAQLQTLMTKQEDNSAFETIVFMFDLIINAE